MCGEAGAVSRPARARRRAGVSDLALLLGPLQDPLLDGALTDEAVDGDLFGLAQPVGPVHGLLVHRGVPVAVVKDDLEPKTQRRQRALLMCWLSSFCRPLTVSAAVRLMPSPPALVLSRKTKMSVLERRKDGGVGSEKLRRKSYYRQIRGNTRSPALEVGHHVSALRNLGGSIQAHVGVLPINHVLLEK